MPYYEDDTVTLHHGDALTVAKTLPAAAAQTIVTSPPYFGLRDYGEAGQIGSEDTVAAYVRALVDLFSELRRVLTDDGTVWLNLGDTYAAKARGTDAGWDKSRLSNPGSVQKRQAASLRKMPSRHRGKADGIGEKNLIGIPWRVAFALQDDGWVLRSDIVWAKSNPMPESVTDRPSRSHEYLFMLAKRPRYYYDAAAIRERDGEGRNRRDVWTIPTVPFPSAHFAAYPPELIRPCILAGSRPGDTVLDPFSGSGTTGMVAGYEGRKYIGIDLNAEYLDLSLRTRFAEPTLGIGAAS